LSKRSATLALCAIGWRLSAPFFRFSARQSALFDAARPGARPAAMRSQRERMCSETENRSIAKRGTRDAAEARHIVEVNRCDRGVECDMLSRSKSLHAKRIAKWSPVLAAVIVAAWGLRLSGAVIVVPANGNLQAALDQARPGDIVTLQAGATYTGNFLLPAKNGTRPIVIRTASEDRRLPGADDRIDTTHADLLPKLKSPNNEPILRTAPGASHWAIVTVEFVGNGVAGDMIALGDGSNAQRDADMLPTDITFDRVLIRGDSERGQKRGIALNSGSTTITGSYIADIKAVGQDSQAICGWNGPGPYIITNNYLEAAGENVLFGGADPSVPNLVPSDIMISGNLISKPLAWRTQNWVVKNLFELKNARRVVVTSNVFENNWEGGQPGYAILFTVRNQDGRCPWCQVDHVTFSGNIVRHSGGGIQMLGSDYSNPSQQTQAILIQNNLFADIDSERWGGNGYFLTIIGAPRDVTIDHNTIISDHGSGVIQADGPPIMQFKFTNNVAKHNSYGIIGTGHGVGADSISRFFPASDIMNNVFAGGSPGAYPSSNSFPAPEQFEAQFVSYTGGDYRLTAASPWHGAGSDGRDLGVVFAAAAGAGTSHRR
jgi:Right handed beta helix region